MLYKDPSSKFRPKSRLKIVLFFKIFGNQISKEISMYSNFSEIDFTFLQKAEITESFYPEFSLEEFFTSMGGAMGLWLGLGVMQLLTQVVNVTKWLSLSYCKNK